MRPNTGLKTERRGPHESTSCVHPSNTRSPRVHGEDGVDGITGREASRVQVGNHEDLRVDGPAKRGSKARVLRRSMQRQARAGGTGDITRRIADVGHGENAKRGRVRSHRESAASEEGRRHTRGRARNDP